MKISFGNILTSSCNDYIILPIELSSFIVTCEKIEFTTESESNVKMFYVETSKDGTWVIIDSLIPSNRNQRTIYQTVNPKLGNYFRLKELDYDNKVVYSDIYFAFCKKQEDEEFEIYNLLGQKIYDIPKGFYILKYRDRFEKRFGGL